jgi:hypothetical protein
MNSESKRIFALSFWRRKHVGFVINNKSEQRRGAVVLLATFMATVKSSE